MRGCGGGAREGQKKIPIRHPEITPLTQCVENHLQTNMMLPRRMGGQALHADS